MRSSKGERIVAYPSASQRECYEDMARRRGLSLSAWLLESADALARSEGGDPDTGAP